MPASRRRACVVAAAALTLAGCSLSGDEQTAADSLATALAGPTADDAAKDRADCLAEKWVGETGTQSLLTDEVLDARFRARPRVVSGLETGRRTATPATAEGYAAAYLACRDYDVEALALRPSYPTATDEDLDEYADCLREISDDDWEQAIVDRLTGVPMTVAMTDLTTATTSCSLALATAAGS